ncbi:BolA family protein [Candidatus Uabimicrobium amorphum]|uniref:BolA family transcriptional regulator n=1 Tax=Uabimicrobium amorphum TaxID=2596890 RepID=A0A5S9F217_UABAM|nr:BolA/IbaG family iron-sulfur metabolism protein [Candidatus Uabimicrobium amorphum]BBM83197.1 BolA family transcriptional regulator [Candidatus Uabimicrobium amorphum]
MTPQQISDTLQAAIPEAEVRVNDYTGGGDHFEVIVMSNSFEGVSRVKRHQMVYKALGNAMDGEIHALALKTLTIAEFQKLANNS